MRRGRATAVVGRPVAGAPRVQVPVARWAAVAGLAVALAVGQLSGPPGAAAAPSWDDSVYETAPDARPVQGAAGGTGGPRLTPGTYTDTISTGRRKSYLVALDDSSNAYVSAVLAPPPGSAVGSGDGIRVTLESPDGARCSVSNDITFGSTTGGPVADYSTRRIGAGRECQRAGDYLYTVEWIGSSSGGPDARSWPVELRYMAEPGLRDGATAPAPPSAWPSHAAEHVTGPARPVGGGTGFNDAPAVGHGAWRDELDPGETRFYKVPLEWGQQLFLDAEFAARADGRPSAKVAGARSLVSDGLRLSVFNTARGFAESAESAYTGGPATVSVGTAPAAFANRTSSQDGTSAMRFSGWYYVRVSLDRRIGRALPMTLRVDIEGQRQSGPEYDGDPVAAGFGVTDEGRAAAADGRVTDDGGNGERDLALTVVGFSGIGLGTVLLLGLLVWTVLGRRRQGRHASAPTPWEPRAH
ncbi:hypothetical protein [Streptomyces sp. NPDC020965]|uniref:hypothetical protein n=1 Tax=Streptomyces sp. NPDC020965 TaxID=3365105 RepID=UPI0037A89433